MYRLHYKGIGKNYLKLNVEFDYYHGESMYSSDKSNQVILMRILE